MSRYNKFLKVTIFLGTMFLAVSAAAMEKDKAETTKKNENESKIILKNEKENNVEEKNKKEDVNIICGREKDETKKNKIIDNKNEIKFLEGAEEKFKKLVYGNTKEEQQEMKELIEDWGFDNEEVYKEMLKCEHKNLLECLIKLMEEKIESFNNYIREFEKYKFIYEKVKSENIDYFNNDYDFYEENDDEYYYDKFYGEEDKFEVKKDDNYKEILELINKKHLDEKIIFNYVDDILSKNQVDKKEIVDYKQLIKKAYDEQIKKNRFILNGYFKETDKKYHNIYTLSSIDLLRKEYEKKKRSLDRFKVIINSDEEESDVDKINEEKFNNRDNEIIKWSKNWIDMWGGNSEYLYGKNKKVNFEHIKKYLKKLVIKDVNKFNKILSIFRKYKCEFNKNEIEDFKKDKNKFFDFDRLNKIIDEKNKYLEKEYNFSIDKKIVSDYIETEVLCSKLLQENINDYRELIKNAYMSYIDISNNYYDRDLDKNLNIYKFYKEGSEKFKNLKQENFDIYDEKALDEFKKQNDEMKSIIEIRNVLEEIKKQDKKDISEECIDILKFEKFCSKSNLKILINQLKQRMGDEEDDEEKIKKQYKKDLSGECIDILKLEKFRLKSNLGNLINQLKLRIDDKEENYIEKFVLILYLAVEEDILEKTIDEIISLTNEAYYPGEFIIKFKEFVKNKFDLLNYLDYIYRRVEHLDSNFGKEDQKIFLKDVMNFNKDIEDNSYDLRKELCEYLKEDLHRAFYFYEYRYEYFYYMNKIEELICKYKLTFFKHLKEIVEKEFRYKNKIHEMKKCLRAIRFTLQSFYYREDGLKNIIEILGDSITEDSKTKLEQIVGESTDKELECFFWNIVRIDYSNIEEFLKRFYDLLEKTYKKLKIREKIDVILDGVNSSNVENFKKSDKYKELRKECEKLYILENDGLESLDLQRMKFCLEYDDKIQRYKVKLKKPKPEPPVFPRRGVLIRVVDGFFVDPETRPGTEI